MRVSLYLAAEGGRLRVAIAALCAVVVAVVVAAGVPSAAHAEFTLKHCEGGPVQGEGSSFQNAAQGELKLVFNSSFGCEGSLSKSPVTYVSDGSGCGIASVGGGPSTGKCSDFESAAAADGYRDPNSRFGGSDAPLNPEQQASANAKGSEHPGLIHILPIAVGATAVIVHFPEGCELENPGPGPSSANENTTTGGPNDPGADDSTGDLYTEGTLRVHIPAGILEQIWDGTPTTWGQITKNHMTGTPTNPLEAEENITTCDSVPVRRLVRFDGSGTTYNFKAYLGLLPVGVGGSTNNPVWEKSPVVGTNTTWPLTTSSTGVPKAVPTKAGTNEFVNECNETVSGPDRICTGSANGNPFVAAAVAATDGSIGYSDLATARQNGFTVTPNKEAATKPEKNDLTYWIPLQTINPEKPVSERVGSNNYVEPTNSPISNIGNGKEVRGSNCTNADYRGIPPITESDPDPTLGDWANAIGTGSKDTTTFPNCAITYDFVWDDDAPVYGNTPEEQGKARTIKDYFTTVESEGGQLSLEGEDYGALSPEIIRIARIGVESIGWNKEAGSGAPKGLETKPTPPPTTTTTTTTTTPTIPSNAFSIASAKVKGKDIVLSLVLPDAGSVQVKATGGGVTVGSASASTSGGKGTVTLAISKAALSKLAKAKGHKLSVKITVTFTPTGGTAATQTKTLTVTQAAVTPPKKKASKKGKKK